MAWPKEPTKIERLYSSLLGYQRSFEDVAMTAGSVAQDLSYLVAEVKEWKDQEELDNGHTIEDQELLEPVIVDDDSDELQGC